MGATWTGCFAAVCALAIGFALAGFRRAQGVLRLAKRSMPALAAAGLMTLVCSRDAPYEGVDLGEGSGVSYPP